MGWHSGIENPSSYTWMTSLLPKKLMPFAQHPLHRVHKDKETVITTPTATTAARMWYAEGLLGIKAPAHQSKSASVQTQGSDSMAPAYFPCIHFRSDFRFLYILLAPMMHASPWKETGISGAWTQHWDIPCTTSRSPGRCSQTSVWSGLRLSALCWQLLCFVLFLC